MSNDSLIGGVCGYVAGLLDSWEIKSFLGGIGLLYTSISGGDVFLLAAVYALMCLDLVFGLCEAFFLGKFTPFRMHRGVIKFLSYSLAIFLIMTVSASINATAGMNLHLQDFFMSYIVACEAISIARHAVRLGWPVPKLLIRIAFAARQRAEQLTESVCDGEKDSSKGREEKGR
ncbi:MAG: phage holin family protein [Desulfovibrionaceae bacterium]|nr:phage holin family protein [Desulfovibrionaceae bacterium]